MIYMSEKQKTRVVGLTTAASSVFPARRELPFASQLAACDTS